jgi:hypothetical protein
MTHNDEDPGSRCHLYLPGHCVHYLKLKKDAEVGLPWSPGRFVDFEDDVIVVELHDGFHRYRNHRPNRVRQIAQADDRVSISAPYSLLEFDRHGHHLMTVCVATAEGQWVPCQNKSRR